MDTLEMVAKDGLENRDGKRSYVGAFQPAWHFLGETVDHLMTAEEIMERSRQNYDVELIQLVSPINGTPINSYATFRTDTGQMLGDGMRAGYTVFQNNELYDLLNAFVGINGSVYDTAGVLGVGETIFASILLSEVMKIKGTEDEIKTYLMGSANHSGQKNVTIAQVDLRVVCQNTLRRALAGAEKYIRIAHRRGLKDKVAAAKELLKNARTSTESMELMLNELAHRKVKKDSFFTVMKRLFGEWEDGEKVNVRKQNKVLEIAEIFDRNDDNRIPEIRGSAYALFNSITNYVDHWSPFRRTKGKNDVSDDVIRSENALFGQGAELKELALGVIMDTTKDDPTYSYKTIHTLGDNPIFDQIMKGNEGVGNA